MALFADLSGYTALCRRLDPEDVELTVAPLMRSLRSAVEAEGGVVANIAGDGFFAMFGVPVALADGPLRALRSAQAMCQLVASRNDQPGLQRVPDVHVGIAAGEVLVTESDEPLGWSVFGNSVNLASRLCDAAGAGEILIDETCRGLIGSNVEWRETRSLALKGHDVDVVAWAPDPLNATSAAAPRSPSFINRRRELAALDTFYRQTVSLAKSRVVHITGPAGIGKSELLSHWLQTAAEPTRRSVWCRGGVAGNSVTSLVKDLAEAAGQPPDDLAALLEAPDTTAVNFSSNVVDRFPALVQIVRRLLIAAAATGPLVVIVDDLPSIDPSLEEIVRDVRERPVDASVLFITTRRTGEGDDHPAGDLDLEPLSNDDIVDLVATVVGRTPPPAVCDAINRRATGYPLMAIQSAAYLLESQIIGVTADGCEVLEPQALDAMPTSLRLSVEARLDQLPAREKSVVQDLSTFGDSADEGFASVLLGGNLRPMLDDLAKRGILRRGSDGRWRFSHALVQEVAYATLTRRARAELHARQLALLPDGSPSELRTFHALARVESVSPGDTKANADAAIAAMTESLRHARSLYASQAHSARAALERVRGLVADYSRLDPETAIGLLLLDAQCLIELGRFDEAFKISTKAEQLTAEHEVSGSLRAQSLLASASALSRLRRYETARQKLDDASAIAERLRDDSLRAQAMYLTAQTWRVTLFSRFVSLTEAAYRLYEVAGDHSGAADCARMVAYLHSVGSASRFDRWYALAEAATPQHDVRGRAWLARALAIASVARLDYAAAETAGRSAVELAEQVGAYDIVIDGLIDTIAALIGLGRIGEGLEVAERLTRLAASQADLRARVLAAANSSHLLLRSGQRARCLEELALAREIVAELGASEDQNVASAEAAIRTDSGRWSEAFAAFDQSEDIGAETGFVLISLSTRLERLRLLVQLNTQVDRAVFESLRDDCLEAGVPIMASFAEAVADLADVLAGRPVTLKDPPASACLDEVALRTDTAALQAETNGAPATDIWKRSRELWQRLGYTVWLARAQARCGDLPAANHTLEVLDSPPAARAWALGPAVD